MVLHIINAGWAAVEPVSRVRLVPKPEQVDFYLSSVNLIRLIQEGAVIGVEGEN